MVKQLLKPVLLRAKLMALSYLLSYTALCKVTCINPLKSWCQQETEV